MKRLFYFIPDVLFVSVLLAVAAPLMVSSFSTIPEPPCWFRPAGLFVAKPVIWSASHSVLLITSVLLIVGWCIARQGFWTRSSWNASWLTNLAVWVFFLPLFGAHFLLQSAVSFEVYGGCIQLGGPEFDAFNSADMVFFFLIIGAPVWFTVSAVLTAAIWSSVRFVHPNPMHTL